jgi:ADP-heptose:LPS heptosyltransferase
MEGPLKILLWKIGALGDVLMTTPLVRQLRHAHPDAQIDYLVGSGCAVMLRGNPHLSHVRVFDERILYGAQARRLVEVVAALRGYDLVFVLDKHWVFGLCAWLARVPRRIGFRRRIAEDLFLTSSVTYGPLAHEIDYYLGLLRAAGLPVDAADRRPQLPPPEPYPLLRPYTVLVNAGGRNAYEQSNVRQLPDPLFREVAQRCAAEHQVVFVGSAPERAYYDALGIPGALNLCGQIGLPQVWWVLQEAARVITTDCGLMHMAAAVNAHVVAAFGPTHPRRLCPPGVRPVWGDEDQYDDDYVLFGKLPRGRYFARLTAEDLFDAARMPESAA